MNLTSESDFFGFHMNEVIKANLIHHLNTSTALFWVVSANFSMQRVVQTYAQEDVKKEFKILLCEDGVRYSTLRVFSH